MKLLLNQAKCKLCGDVIQSTSIHDIKQCKCGSISVDGGNEYVRRIGNLDAVEELSIYDE